MGKIKEVPSIRDKCRRKICEFEIPLDLTVLVGATSQTPTSYYCTCRFVYKHFAKSMLCNKEVRMILSAYLL